MDESVQEGEGELRRRNLEGNTPRGELGNVDADTAEQQQQVEVKERVVDSEAEDRAVVGEEIAKSIGQDKPPEVRQNSGCRVVLNLIRGATV